MMQGLQTLAQLSFITIPAQTFYGKVLGRVKLFATAIDMERMDDDRGSDSRDSEALSHDDSFADILIVCLNYAKERKIPMTKELRRTFKLLHVPLKTFFFLRAAN